MVVVPKDLILVGHIVGAYGVHGAIRIRPYSTNADALLRVQAWWLDKPELHDVDVLSAKLHGGDVVAHLTGVVSRDAAEKLKGATVQIARSRFPALEDDEFYWVDLIGLLVESQQGVGLGQVIRVIEHGAHPILEVADLEQKTQAILIPFVAKFIQTVDQVAKKIIVDWEADY